MTAWDCLLETMWWSLEWFAVFWLCIILSLWKRGFSWAWTSQLYKYYTFLLLSQLFYQCYGINTAIDIMYEYKWSLLFSTRHSGVNDVFWAGRLDWTVFSISLLHHDRKCKPAQNRARTQNIWAAGYLLRHQTLNGSQASQTNYRSSEQLWMLTGNSG